MYSLRVAERSYGNNGKIVYSETDTYVDECESPYTASKIGSEALVRSYGKCYDIDVSIARFSNVYGKYDVSDRVVPLFVAQANNGDDLTVYGDDKMLDFTHIDDCISGVVSLIEQFTKASGTTFNIASGQGSSLVELGQTIINRLDVEASVSVKPSRTGEIIRYVADLSKARTILGYEPEYTLDEGLDSTIEWYLDRPELFDATLESNGSGNPRVRIV